MLNGRTIVKLDKEWMQVDGKMCGMCTPETGPCRIAKQFGELCKQPNTGSGRVDESFWGICAGSPDYEDNSDQACWKIYGTDSAVGKKISSTQRLAWRGGKPSQHEKPVSGDQLVVVWMLEGGGMVVPVADAAGSRPLPAIEVWEEYGTEWDLEIFRTPGEQRAAAAARVRAVAESKCACGNHKTPGHADGLCHACRTKGGAPAGLAVPQAAPPRCACGNFQSGNSDALCNACRKKK